MTESEALELGNKLYANITSNANNIIKTNDYIEFVRMAINALEKHIPKKPDFYRNLYHCPICTKIVAKGTGNKRYGRSYVCRYCLQVLDWGEEE